MRCSPILPHSTTAQAVNSLNPGNSSLKTVKYTLQQLIVAFMFNHVTTTSINPPFWISTIWLCSVKIPLSPLSTLHAHDTPWILKNLSVDTRIIKRAVRLELLNEHTQSGQLVQTSVLPTTIQRYRDLTRYCLQTNPMFRTAHQKLLSTAFNISFFLPEANAKR